MKVHNGKNRVSMLKLKLLRKNFKIRLGKWFASTRPKTRFGWTVSTIVLVSCLMVAGSSALYWHNHTTRNTALLTKNSYNKPASSDSKASTSQATVKTPVTTSTSNPASTTPTKYASCSQAQAIFGPALTTEVTDAWSTWSDSTYYTSAEINYEYNQSAQQDYSEYTSLMQASGCSPQSPSPLKYPATDPNSTSSPTYTAPAPTCNTTLEASYENSYESQNQVLMEQESSEIQNLQEQIAAAGSGSSSAYNAVPSEVAQQFSSQFANLKDSLNSELTSINCSNS
jgi:hypothetical protein